MTQTSHTTDGHSTASLNLALLHAMSPSLTVKLFWTHLIAILNTPRPSTDFDGGQPIRSRLDKIRHYIATVAASEGFQYREDAVGNVGIRSAPEKFPVLFCMQGHLDIVCSKNDGVEHNFESDGINVKLECESHGQGNAYCIGRFSSSSCSSSNPSPSCRLWMRSAVPTTLGADNGVAIACALAVMTTWKFLPLEALFTVDEETTFAGASSVEPVGFVTARAILNLDSEEGGRICVGNAGGVER